MDDSGGPTLESLTFGANTQTPDDEKEHTMKTETKNEAAILNEAANQLDAAFSEKPRKTAKKPAKAAKAERTAKVKAERAKKGQGRRATGTPMLRPCASGRWRAADRSCNTSAPRS